MALPVPKTTSATGIWTITFKGKLFLVTLTEFVTDYAYRRLLC